MQTGNQGKSFFSSFTFKMFLVVAIVFGIAYAVDRHVGCCTGLSKWAFVASFPLILIIGFVLLRRDNR